MSNNYEFTQDWFHWAPEVWKQLIPMMKERKAFLEIGSFEGRSAVWTIENMLDDDGFIDCVDTWDGGEEHVNGEMDGAEGRFYRNIEKALGVHRIKDRRPEGKLGHISYYGTNKAGNPVSAYKYKTLSTHMLATKIASRMDAYSPEHVPFYDFIYIDGSHTAPDVLTDAIMAWQLLKEGGLMVFDDYTWGNPRDALHRPKIAIDLFTNVFVEQCDIIHIGYQAVIRKKEGAIPCK